MINSDIEHIGYDKRLSPVDSVVKISEEYARDLSVKTIYKFQQGFPKHWRYASTCPSCDGLGKDGEGHTCGDCNGTGELFSRDVTNEDRLTVPEEGQSVIAPASGYVNPALEYLADTRIELKELEDTATFTHWGATINTEGVATATEIVINTQPVVQRLNKYADIAENMLNTLTEMIANNMFITKDKAVRVSSTALGRNYIIESLSAVLTRYEAAKENGDSITILDRLYQEYLLTKYKNDDVGLAIALTKSSVEVHIHYTAEQILELLGEKEAARKVMFSDFWKTVVNFDLSAEALRTQYNTYFEANYKPVVEESTTEG